MTGLVEERRNNMTIYGYVRVSSTDQNEDHQMIALRQLSQIP